MDPSHSFTQPSEDCSSSEKSEMFQPIAKPPVYQDNFVGYVPSFPGQSVVTVQPAVFVPTTAVANPVPLTNPMPEYTCYSVFTLLCCCLPLGTAALVYSLTFSGDYYPSKKSVMLQPSSVPPAYQDNPAGHDPSFASQPVSQGSYTQGPYPGQSVVFVPTAPLTNPAPEHICYSIFTMLCCCFSLGTAALVYSLSTRNANYSGQQELAERNSKTARNLNHIALAIGLMCILGYVLFYVYLFVLPKNI